MYPQRLLKTKNFPTIIYAIGNIELLNCKYAVGIVGSRKCTEYGRKVANQFAQDLSREGICIISGMALGIDGEAHNAAIKEIGKTIAVLGGGFNYIFPPENEWLFHKILENGGCVITEYPPEVEPDKNNFPIRNRIISGLSDALLVVEAAHRSGSTITAKYAKNEQKAVYAIPNNIYTSAGIGTNRLIQEGAILTTRVEQIIEGIGWKAERVDKREKLEYKLKQEKIKDNEKQVLEDKKEILPKTMPAEYLPIYKLLEDEPQHINEISRKLDVPIQEINSIITMMEIDGYANQPKTNYFSRNLICNY